MANEEKANMHLTELDFLDEDRLAAQENLELYRLWMSNAFNKHVQLRSFKEGDLNLIILAPVIIDKKKWMLEPTGRASS